MKNRLGEDFKDILEDNKHKIYRICRSYAKPPLEPEDLFQEVVYEVWKSFSAFKGKSSVSTWIYRIALNVCNRSRMQMQRKNIKTVRFESIQFESVENSFNKKQQEKSEALHDCISSLNKSDQSIVILYLEDLPYKEIATIIGLTENYVAVKMKRIRKQLFDCIMTKIN
mgnify:CR=1 FL=1